MVSLPLNPPDPSVVKVFPGASSNAFGYTGSGYNIANQLQVGKGYWLKFSQAETLAVKGDSLQADTVSVNDGWIMIGAISSCVAVHDLTSLPGGLITSEFFGYSNGYVPTDSLRPGKGYWVKVSEAGKLIIETVHGGTLPKETLANRIHIVPIDEAPPATPSETNSADQPATPQTFALAQCYPNPFNPTTNIQFSLPKQAYVSLKVFNVLGQLVATPVNEVRPEGTYSVAWSANSLPSGIYFYQLQAGAYSGVKKMILLK